MPTDSQLSANRANAQHSTGPRTDAGKAASSHNALTHGLFTTRDFIQPGEEANYDRFVAAYREELSPQTILEETYVSALIGAAWRMRRCSLVEANMSDYIGGDPMESGFGQKMQTSVDRARSQAFNMLQRSTRELRRLQTDRALRRQLQAAAGESPAGESKTPLSEAYSGLSSPQQIVSTLAHAKRAKLFPLQPCAGDLASNCKSPQSSASDEKSDPCGSREHPAADLDRAA
jgi:hypothetical protein